MRGSAAKPGQKQDPTPSGGAAVSGKSPGSAWQEPDDGAAGDRRAPEPRLWGIDFSWLPDGRTLVFEANAIILVHPEEDVRLAFRNPAGGPLSSDEKQVSGHLTTASRQ
jgi:hypothetical protein